MNGEEMRLSPAVLMSWQLAALETIYLRKKEISPELFFAGITKLQDVTSPAALKKFGFSQEDRRAYFAEMDGVLALLADHGIDPRGIRHSLRAMIGTGNYTWDENTPGAVHRSDQTRAVFVNAEKRLERSGSSELSLSAIVYAILESETEHLDALLENMGVNKQILCTIFDPTSFPDMPPGLIEDSQIASETIPPASIPEDERIAQLAEIMMVVSYAKTSEELYEGCLQKILQFMPKAEQVTILLQNDNEIFPVKHHPRDRAYHSSSLAAQSIQKRRAFIWNRIDDQQEVLPGSLFDTVSAVYAPMILNGHILGAIHASSTSPDKIFSKADLDTLCVVAGSIAHAVPQKTSASQTPSVFISYSHANRRFVRRLSNDLRKRGVSVWMDDRLRSADETWRKQLSIAIEKQLGFIFLVTPKSVDSQYCLWELEIALKNKKNIIPLMYKKASLPASIATMQYINFERGYNDGLVALIGTIERIAIEYHP